VAALLAGGFPRPSGHAYVIILHRHHADLRGIVSETKRNLQCPPRAFRIQYGILRLFNAIYQLIFGI
jgi:hypothetical protein